jgi:hypothetical protein
MLQTILNGFGVREDDGELTVEATPEHFPQKKHALLQAMMAVNDLFVTSAPRVVKFFLEDVSAFLAEHDVRFSRSVEFTGRSGFVHRFDFLIPPSKLQPERIVRAINNPSKDQATALIFSWTDTKEVRPSNALLYAVLNDAEKTPSAEILGAFEQYNVRPILWSERQRYAKELSA